LKSSGNKLRGYGEVCAALDARQRITLGLERMERLLSLLGEPQRDFGTVQVVGTNGKGTTTVTLAAALTACGHPAGAYLSPHLISYTERILLPSGYVSEEEFARVMDRVMRLDDEMGVGASQFEILTAGALLLFREAGLGWAVLEAGMGARHDATSVVRPPVVVLTNVGLDHTEYLGETVEEIAREKLASVQPGGTLVLGTGDPLVVRLARERCGETGAWLVPASGGAVEWDRLAPYAARDAALGLRAAEVVLGRALGERERKEALERAAGVLPGRFEVHEREGVPVVVDGGHNPPGIRATIEAVAVRFGGRPLGVVFGCLRDKEVASMLDTVAGASDALVLTRPESGRAADPHRLIVEHDPRDRRGKEAVVVEEVGEAVGRMVEKMRREGGVVLVTGSLYTCAAAIRWLREG